MLPNWLPPGLPEPPQSGPILCQRDYLTPRQGHQVLEAALRAFPTRETWEAYAQNVRAQLQIGAGLSPFPKRTPLRPIVRSRRVFDGYSAQNVALETVPGFWATGNLFRPLDIPARAAAILTTHGHMRNLENPEDFTDHGRFSPSVQLRAANLARMGAVVLSLDMWGYGDGVAQIGQAAHPTPFAMTMQIWNAMRALDFLESLDEVDPNRLAVTGESGGAMQAMLLTALDARVAACVPVAMVSSYFFGGCACESGRPIHRSATHFAPNTLLAALAAPRPMLVVSDGDDWTQHVPRDDFPFLQAIYNHFGARQNVANAHFEAEGHDFGPSKRAAMFRFVSEHLGLDFAAICNSTGTLDETRVSIEAPQALHVFDADFPIPHHALRDAAAVERAFRDLQAQLRS